MRKADFKLMAMVLARWLDQQLTTRHWSERQFARIAGVSHGTVNRVVNGAGLPRGDSQVLMAAALGVTVDEMWRRARGGLETDAEGDYLTDEILRMIGLLETDERQYVFEILRHYIETEHPDCVYWVVAK